MTRAARIHRQRILERTPRVEVMRVPCAPWLTFPLDRVTRINSPAMTRGGDA